MSAATHTGPVRLLLVDDDAAIRALLEVTVEFDERFELLGAARNGGELLESVARFADIDAVLIDVTLPDRDGVDLVTDVRALLPHAAIALYTGWSEPELVERAMAAGADRVFTKTADTRTLLDELLTLVE